MDIVKKRIHGFLYKEETEHDMSDLESLTIASTARPKTILTYAQSLDGCIGKVGSQLLLSSPESLQMTHLLRSLCDGILVGIGTVLNDAPSLTTRLAGIDGDQKNARPIIVDPRLECPLNAKFLSRERNPILLSCPKSFPVPNEQRQALINAGALIVDIDPIPGAKRPRIDLVKALEYLAVHFPIKSVMIEGGAAVIQECLSRSDFIIDGLIITIAPILVGLDEGINPLKTTQGIERDAVKLKIPQLDKIEWIQLGNDSVLFAKCVK